ncbi:hypothetical protein ACNPQM_33350 [Streptomyces sp. NPDC056231]|uniref:hypothetical protein n=1 Tax=Streptomyces sp. NPDC056231 TaxID=3345755 RepID=UPI003AAEE31B
MCGIAGWVSFDHDLRAAADVATLDAMTETMACRGPDDRGTWIADSAGLGHRRLAGISPLLISSCTRSVPVTTGTDRTS